MKKERTHIAITSISPSSSAGLPLSIAEALCPFVGSAQVFPRENKFRNLFQMIRSFRPSRRSWSQAYEQKKSHTLKSWHLFSQEISTNLALRESSHILQVGLHFNSFPKGYTGARTLFLHGTLSMILESRYPCSMWLPPNNEIDGWLQLEKETMEEADAVFLGADHLHDEILRNYSIDPTKLVVVGTGRPAFPPLDQEEMRIVKHSAPTFLFVGKDFDRKGGAILLDAFQHARKKIPELVLHIVGPKQLPGSVPENVIFHGTIHDRKKLRSIFLQSHAFVLPTLHDSFGLVLLEAMHFSLPCIGTDIFAIPEIIENGRTGLIVPPGDVSALAEAMLRLAENKSEAREMGERGQTRAEEYFNWQAVAGRMIDKMNTFAP